MRGLLHAVDGHCQSEVIVNEWHSVISCVHHACDNVREMNSKCE